MRNHALRCSGLALALLLQCLTLSSRVLACVVGTGTGASCTEAALTGCLPGGGSFDGTVTFQCGGAATITVTSTKTISADTTIDGGSLITISGGNRVGVFYTTGVNFTVQNLAIANGNSAASFGGAILNEGTLTVTNTNFSGNSAYYGGGGISNGGTLTVANSTFSGNSVVNNGGAIFTNGGTLTVTNSTFSRNGASSGGAIYSSYSTLMVTNSTFAGNGATSGGGGIFAAGGIVSENALTVTNDTFSSNSATSGSAIENIENGGSTLMVTNTIVANTTSGGNCYGAVTDGGHNIDDGTSCGFASATGSLSNTTPMLDPAGLANNGGPTQTIALQAGSPAIDAGNESLCAVPPINNLDQRGYTRPGIGAANCSIGAYEYNSLPPCCQCPASCAAPINGSCGDCTVVVGAACRNGDLCVPYTPTPSPTLTPTVPSPTPTRPTPTMPSATPTLTPTNTPGASACCQCASFCAAPIAGTCGGCAVMFGASCTGGVQCVSRTPATTPCVGNCNDDGTVTIDEILTMVNIALGNSDVSTCMAGDANKDRKIIVAEILTAVNNALNGCGGG